MLYKSPALLLLLLLSAICNDNVLQLHKQNKLIKRHQNVSMSSGIQAHFYVNIRVQKWIMFPFRVVAIYVKYRRRAHRREESCVRIMRGVRHRACSRAICPSANVSVLRVTREITSGGENASLCSHDRLSLLFRVLFPFSPDFCYFVFSSLVLFIAVSR